MRESIRCRAARHSPRSSRSRGLARSASAPSTSKQPPILVGHVVESRVGRAGLEQRRELALRDARNRRSARAAPSIRSTARSSAGASTPPMRARSIASRTSDLGRGKRPALGEERRRLARLREPCARLLARRGKPEPEREVAPQRPGAAIGQSGEDAVPLEVGARLRRARIGTKRVQGAAENSAGPGARPAEGAGPCARSPRLAVEVEDGSLFRWRDGP